MYYSSYYQPMSVEQESRQQAPPPRPPGSPPPRPPAPPPAPPTGGGTNARIEQLQRQITSLNRRVNRIENMLGMRYYY